MRKSFGVFVLGAFSLVGVKGASAAPNGYVSTPFADQVVVFDTADNSIVTTVGVGKFPRGLAVSPDGSKVYVANQGDDTNSIASSISVIDTASNTAGTPIETSSDGSAQTEFVIFSPDGSKAYASNGGTDEVVVMDTATDSIIDNIPTGARPQGLAVNHAGTRLYAANQTDGTVTVIDTSNDQVVTTVVVSPTAGCSQVLVTLDDKKIYVSNAFDNSVSVIDASNNTVSGSPIPMDPAGVPYGLLLTSDGSTVAVFEHIGNAIKIIDVATDQVVDTVPIPGTDPFLAVFHPTSGLAYFAGGHVNTINPVGTVLVAP
ncbi:MAG: beta-propeller fold lactonase family protein, partial [Deltaproteobacteria bacterium]|nr:beta-propeller fold lactonase family protein [Deltaproteobacteria bacterium]